MLKMGSARTDCWTNQDFAMEKVWPQARQRRLRRMAASTASPSEAPTTQPAIPPLKAPTMAPATAPSGGTTGVATAPMATPTSAPVMTPDRAPEMPPAAPAIVPIAAPAFFAVSRSTTRLDWHAGQTQPDALARAGGSIGSNEEGSYASCIGKGRSKRHVRWGEAACLKQTAKSPARPRGPAGLHERVSRYGLLDKGICG